MKSKAQALSKKTFLYLSLFWIVFGLFSITSSYVYFIESSTPFDWTGRLLSRMPVYVIWILFIPVISYFVSKYRIESPVKLKNIFILFSAGIIIAALHRIISVLSIAFLESGFLGKEANLYKSLFEEKFALFAYMFDSYIMYWIIISILLSIEYYRKYNENRLKAAELEKELARAEVSALRMQINPHFLFNTLHSISALTHKNADEADSMICLLSDLLRLSLDNTGRHFVPLKTELEFIEIYLNIQKIRHKERLSVNINADRNTHSIEVPNLILQPIVENSIKHVLEKNSGICTLDISSNVEHENLLIKVKDNGGGISPEIDPFSSGVGLSNTKSRLDHLYGKEYEISCSYGNSEGFEITLKLPIQNDQNNNS